MNLTQKQTKIIIIATTISVIAGLATLAYYKLIKPKIDKVKKSDQNITENNSKDKEIPNSSESEVLKKLKLKLSKIEYIIAPFALKDGKIIYVEAKDFKPTSENQEATTGIKQTMWIQAQKAIIETTKGFNEENISINDKKYGNNQISLIQNKLNSIFDPSLYNLQTNWYKEYLNKMAKTNIITDFWKQL